MMNRQRRNLFLIFLVFLVSVTFSFDQPILYVKDNRNSQGTHLELYDPGSGKTIQVTDATTPGLFNLSFPVFCDRTGLIGFTNHTQSMAAEVYVIDPNNTTPRKIVDGAILEDISPDGKQLLVSGASSSPSLYLVDVATHQLEQITKGYTVSSARFSPDGQSVVFGVMDKTGSMDIYKLNLSNKQISPLIQTSQWSEYFPAFTQDGQYLMFMTNRTGQWGVDYVDMNTNKRYQANLWGMYPSLSSDDAWTALEKDGQILISKTTGKELQTLGNGSTPQWISLSAAGRFLGSSPTQVATTSQPGKLLTSKQIGPQGGTVEVAGQITINIPAGTIEAGSSNKTLSVSSAQIEGVNGKIFDLEWEDSPELFSQLVEIYIPLAKNEKPEDFVAIDEITEDLWIVLPSKYDAKNHAITFNTAHFSKKGLLSEIGSQDVREFVSGAVGSIGTGIGVIIITGSTAISLPAIGAMAVGGYLISKTGIADPAMDKGFEWYYGINKMFSIGDGVSVSWVDDPKSPSNLPGDKVLVCVEKGTNQILFAVYDKGTDTKQRAAAMAAMFPGSNYLLVNVPKIIFELAVEMKWIKNYYKQNGYNVPPKTDVWIYDLDTSGGWNGTKLEIDVDYFADTSEKTKASRMVVLAHEYWHSVYQYNGFSPDFKWLDECLATTYESQALPESKRWYTQTVLPRYEHFYDMYKAENVAQSLRSGMVFEGEKGTDADRIKRGYHFWPWGKFLLATQSHEEIRNLLKDDMDSKMLSSYFDLFCKGILLSDYEIENGVPEDVPFAGQTVSYESISAWSALQVKSFISPSILTTGSAKANFSQGVYLKPIPLSMNILKFQSQLPNDQSPLVIRRATPDEREEFIALNPQKTGNAAGRQRYDDTLTGDGILIVTRTWLNTAAKTTEFPVAIINSATEENWSEYFGYGENPLYAYFLQKPLNPQIKEANGKLDFSWTVPPFGQGLTEKNCLSGYNVYLADKDLKKVHFLTSVSPDKNQTNIAYYQVASYDMIGIASVDKYAKDASGKPLISQIAWIPLQTGKGTWKKVDEYYSYRFGTSFIDSVSGQKSSATHETGSNKFELNLSSTGAKTLCSNYALYTGGSETASFSHSWSALPATLRPGQSINLTINVADNGSSGKNALDLRGSTEFEIYSYGKTIREKVEAGGSLYTKVGSWKPSDSKTLTWTVPTPTTLEMTQPKQNRLKISVIVKSQSNETTNGYYTVEYEYQP
jgi:hypothetical protein